MFGKSTRFNSMIWYLIILAVTLSLFSGLIYGNFKRSIYEELDDLLVQRAQDLSNSLTTYFRFHPEASNGKTDLQALLNGPDFANSAREWLRVKSQDPDLVDVSVRILDAVGKTVAISELAPKLTALKEESMQDILKGEDSTDIVRGETPDGKKHQFRLYSLPVLYKERVIGVVQTASYIHLLELAMHNLGFVLCVFLPLTVLLDGIPGIFLVKTTLSPVDRMIRTIQGITSGNLKLRIHIPDTKDEIKRLADTFNQMLDRLERSLTCQGAFVEAVAGRVRESMEALGRDIGTVIAQKTADEKDGKILPDCLKRIQSLSESLESLEILTNIEGGRVPLVIRKVDVSSVATEAIKHFQPKAEAKRIELVSYVDPGVELDCDESRIRELFQLILDNAVKYTDRKGKIVVTVKQADRDVKISVTDTGTGMPEEEIPYIFDRFYQISSGKRHQGGFGIGLSVAKVIVDEHHGTLEASSRLGQGSTFTISFPKA